LFILFVNFVCLFCLFILFVYSQLISTLRISSMKYSIIGGNLSGDPDGRYNFKDALLAGITPYTGPQACHMGSDRNYQQIPHRNQFPVPKIWLPEPAWDAETLLDMSHPIDMGDLVFIVNMNYKQYVLSGKLPTVQDAEDNTLPNYNVFCNICSVNYLLAGIQNFSFYYILIPDEVGARKD
jgi:hypothetical protein